MVIKLTCDVVTEARQHNLPGFTMAAANIAVTVCRTHCFAWEGCIISDMFQPCCPIGRIEQLETQVERLIILASDTHG